jgi:hypothetical protein
MTESERDQLEADAVMLADRFAGELRKEVACGRLHIATIVMLFSRTA